MPRGNPSPELHPENLEPEAAPLTHQGYRWLNRGLAPLCAKCLLRERCPEYLPEDDDRECPLAKEAEATLITETMRLPQLQPEDFPLVSEWAKQTVFLALVDRYIGEVGAFVADRKKGTLDLQPVLKVRYTIAGHCARLSDRLGLNPLARQRLKDTSSEGAGALVRALATLSLPEGEG